MRNNHAERRYASAAAFALVVAVGCGSGGAGSRPPTFGAADTLSATTSVGTAPMFAISKTGRQAVAWVSAPAGGTDGRLYVSVGGQKPTEIRDAIGPIEAHGETPPKLAYATDGALYAVYVVGKVVPHERFPLSALRLVKSSDDGATWSVPVTVTGTDVFGAHSYEGMHVASDGTIYVSWLGAPPGGKGTAQSKPATGAMPDMPATPSGGMAMPAENAHAAAGSWISHSSDAGVTWSPPVRVDTGAACPCCRTALATANDGTIYMAWRHVYPGSIRDIVVARSSDHGATWSDPVRVHADDWKFDACPHAGPSIAVDSAGAVHVAWWTGKEGNAGVFYAKSINGAKSFSAPVPLGVAQFSQAAHVQLALATKGRVVVAWDDGTKQIPQVVVRISPDDGAHFSEAIPLSLSGSAASFPVLAVAGDSIAVAWSEVTAAVAQAKADAKRNMKDPKAPQGLDPVGTAQVIVRRGVFQ